MACMSERSLPAGLGDHSDIWWVPVEQAILVAIKIIELLEQVTT